jgi:DNA-binding Lrp family transcriptional regulator
MATPDALDLKILNLLQHDADLQIEDIGRGSDCQPVPAGGVSNSLKKKASSAVA